MKEIRVFIILAIISYLARRVSIWVSKDIFIDAMETTGTITKIIVCDDGTIMYYVSFTTDEGRYIEGQSIYYSSTKGKYKKNDTVPIKYLINKRGRALVSLVDDDLVPCRESGKTAARNMLIASIVFLIIAAIFFVKNILL